VTTAVNIDASRTAYVTVITAVTIALSGPHYRRSRYTHSVRARLRRNALLYTKDTGGGKVLGLHAWAGLARIRNT